MAFIHKHTGNEWVRTTDGEANFYGIASGKNWLMRVQQNGELLVSEQEANIKLIENAPKLIQIAEMFYDHLGSKESIIKIIVTEVLADIGVFGDKEGEVRDKVAETKVEYNVGLIGAFMEHYKEETGKEIHESIFNSFFNV